tara:strand:- start:2025 stop:3014 length:990 start_codon:yes stop_codon:yes gene_type:complete
MKSNITHFLILLILLLNFNIKAYAQNNNDVIINKLNSLERDLRDVQRKIYQSKDPISEIPSDNLNNDNTVTSKGLANHELRLIEMEEQYRKTNGLIEELTFKINQLENENSSLKETIENLVNKLNNFNISKQDISNQEINYPNIEQETITENNNKNSNEGILARINPDGQDEIVQTINPNENQQNNNLLTDNNVNEAINVPKDPKEIYQRAYNMLSTGEYEAAEVAFTKFIKEYPDNKLSSNAYYWLGETFYVRKNYQLAAYNFAAGYKKFPEGSKAADQLLKLGISLFSLEKLTEACATFKKLLEEFPKMPPRILTRANSFQERLECK